MEFLDGRMEKFLMVNGKWVLKMDMDFGNRLMVAIIKANGFSICSMVKESMFIQLEHMKENLKTFVKKEMVNKLFRTEIFLRANTKMECQMGKVSTSGKMAHATRVIL